tara:strand:- start:5488 stop:6384 length:897 start_codon:yes stop_codon:yes gene_type:complete
MSASASSISDQTQPRLDVLLKDIQSLENLTADWDEQQRNTVEALKRAIDELHKEAIARLIKSLKTEPAAMSVLQEAVTDEVVYAVLRHLEIIKPSLQERLEIALDSVRPMLESHNGNVELVSLEPPDTIEIRLLGACDGCPASGLTLSEGIEKAVKEHCPEITNIKKAKGGLHASLNKDDGDAKPIHFVSPFARKEDVGWKYIAKVNEIPEQDIATKDLDGHSLILSRFDDRITCFENACAHLGMPLDMGGIENGILTCPHHAFQYSLQSGECLTAPEVQLLAHGVRIVGDNVEVKLL